MFTIAILLVDKIVPKAKLLLRNSSQILAQYLLLFPHSSCYYQAHVKLSAPYRRKTAKKTHKSSIKRKTVPLMVWVSPSVKAEIQRLAACNGLSVSKLSGTLLVEAIRQQLHIQHAVLLQPIIEQTIRKQMRMIATRLTWLLGRVAFDAGQTRSLVTNILGRQPGVTQPVLEQILDGSSKTAKSNLMSRTPQLAALLEAVEKWMGEEEEAETHG